MLVIQNNELFFIDIYCRWIIYLKLIFITGGNTMPNIGVPGLIIILVIALIVFGPSKLPQLGKALGQTLREFKNSTKDIVDEVTDEFKIDNKESLDKKKS